MRYVNLSTILVYRLVSKKVDNAFSNFFVNIAVCTDDYEGLSIASLWAVLPTSLESEQNVET